MNTLRMTNFRLYRRIAGAALTLCVGYTFVASAILAVRMVRYEAGPEIARAKSDDAHDTAMLRSMILEAASAGISNTLQRDRDRIDLIDAMKRVRSINTALVLETRAATWLYQYGDDPELRMEARKLAARNVPMMDRSVPLLRETQADQAYLERWLPMFTPIVRLAPALDTEGSMRRTLPQIAAVFAAPPSLTLATSGAFSASTPGSPALR